MLGQNLDLRRVLLFQFVIVSGKRDFLWVYFCSSFIALGGSDTRHF